MAEIKKNAVSSLQDLARALAEAKRQVLSFGAAFPKVEQKFRQIFSPHESIISKAGYDLTQAEFGMGDLQKAAQKRLAKKFSSEEIDEVQTRTEQVQSFIQRLSKYSGNPQAQRLILNQQAFKAAHPSITTTGALGTLMATAENIKTAGTALLKDIGTATTKGAVVTASLAPAFDVTAYMATAKGAATAAGSLGAAWAARFGFGEKTQEFVGQIARQFVESATKKRIAAQEIGISAGMNILDVFAKANIPVSEEMMDFIAGNSLGYGQRRVKSQERLVTKLGRLDTGGALGSSVAAVKDMFKELLEGLKKMLADFLPSLNPSRKRTPTPGD